MTVQVRKEVNAQGEEKYFLIVDNCKVYSGTMEEVNRLAYKKPLDRPARDFTRG